jgi:hypothetical protein
MHKSGSLASAPWARPTKRSIFGGIGLAAATLTFFSFVGVPIVPTGTVRAGGYSPAQDLATRTALRRSTLTGSDLPAGFDPAVVATHVDGAAPVPGPPGAGPLSGCAALLVDPIAGVRATPDAGSDGQFATVDLAVPDRTGSGPARSGRARSGGPPTGGPPTGGSATGRRALTGVGLRQTIALFAADRAGRVLAQLRTMLAACRRSAADPALALTELPVPASGDGGYAFTFTLGKPPTRAGYLAAVQLGPAVCVLRYLGPAAPATSALTSAEAITAMLGRASGKLVPLVRLIPH